jgi:hypothetical protein
MVAPSLVMIWQFQHVGDAGPDDSQDHHARDAHSGEMGCLCTDNRQGCSEHDRRDQELARR